MKYCVIGMGKLGAAIVNALLLKSTGDMVYVYEPHGPNKDLARAEFYDLLPVATDTMNKLLWCDKPPNSNCYIITSGLPRKSADQTKKELLKDNQEIVMRVLFDLGRVLDRYKPVFIATNPCVELCESLEHTKYKLKPLRACTDNLRRRSGIGTEENDYVLAKKGFTQFTPGFAIAIQVIGDMYRTKGAGYFGC